MTIDVHFWMTEHLLERRRAIAPSLPLNQHHSDDNPGQECHTVDHIKRGLLLETHEGPSSSYPVELVFVAIAHCSQVHLEHFLVIFELPGGETASDLRDRPPASE